MAVRVVTFENKASTGSALTINPTNIAFSAKFIKGNTLTSMQKIQFLQDDENDYWLGFKFFETGDSPDLLALTFAKDAATRLVASGGLYGRSAVLKSVSSMESKASRTFEIGFDKLNNCWFITLMPSFEISVLWKDKGLIPDSAAGIYRYFDASGQLIYIGKGLIKSRLNSPERASWGISKIEYSIIGSDEESYKWESYYLQDFKARFGLLPPMNRVLGHTS